MKHFTLVKKKKRRIDNGQWLTLETSRLWRHENGLEFWEVDECHKSKDGDTLWHRKAWRENRNGSPGGGVANLSYWLNHHKRENT